MAIRILRIHREEQAASLMAAAGVIWVAQVITSGPINPSAIVLPSGPLEVCAIGVLMWLHAKWRRSLKAE